MNTPTVGTKNSVKKPIVPGMTTVPMNKIGK